MNEDGLCWFGHLVNIEVVDDGVEAGIEVIQQSHHLHSQSDRTSSSDMTFRLIWGQINRQPHVRQTGMSCDAASHLHWRALR